MGMEHGNKGHWFCFYVLLFKGFFTSKILVLTILEMEGIGLIGLDSSSSFLVALTWYVPLPHPSLTIIASRIICMLLLDTVSKVPIVLPTIGVKSMGRFEGNASQLLILWCIIRPFSRRYRKGSKRYTVRQQQTNLPACWSSKLGQEALHTG